MYRILLRQYENRTKFEVALETEKNDYQLNIVSLKIQGCEYLNQIISGNNARKYSEGVRKDGIGYILGSQYSAPADSIRLQNNDSILTELPTRQNDLIKSAFLVFDWLYSYMISPQAISIDPLLQNEFIINHFHRPGNVKYIYFASNSIKSKYPEQIAKLLDLGYLNQITFYANGTPIAKNYFTHLSPLPGLHFEDNSLQKAWKEFVSELDKKMRSQNL